MLIELWPIDRPKDYPQNPRKWSAHAVEKVAASIREYGWRQPVVVDADDVIAIGHLRRAAGRVPRVDRSSRCTWRTILRRRRSAAFAWRTTAPTRKRRGTKKPWLGSYKRSRTWTSISASPDSTLARLTSCSCSMMRREPTPLHRCRIRRCHGWAICGCVEIRLTSIACSAETRPVPRSWRVCSANASRGSW